MGPWNHVLDASAHGRHVTNTQGFAGPAVLKMNKLRLVEVCL